MWRRCQLHVSFDLWPPDWVCSKPGPYSSVSKSGAVDIEIWPWSVSGGVRQLENQQLLNRLLHLQILWPGYGTCSLFCQLPGGHTAPAAITALELFHPRQPGSEHTVAETLANRPGPNTFHVVVECHSRPITALPYCLPTHSTACWYSWGFQKLTRISEIARDSGRLSANHVASYIDVLLGRNEHGSSHGICLSTGKFKISWICEWKCATLSPKTHR